LPDAVQVRAELLEDLGGDALALPDQPEQDVLGADVVVAQLERLAERELQDLLRARCERDVTGRGGLTLTDDLFHLRTDGFQGDIEGLERLRCHAFALVDQPQEDVLRPDVVVVEHPRLFLGEDDDPPRTVREPFKHMSFRMTRELGGPREAGDMPHRSDSLVESSSR
jgi:hypothetical protein